MRHALVFGGSGQIGRPLLALLQREGWRVTAVSRHPQSNEPGLQWLRGRLGAVDGLPTRVDAIVSCGPLDAFALENSSHASLFEEIADTVDVLVVSREDAPLVFERVAERNMGDVMQ